MAAVTVTPSQLVLTASILTPRHINPQVLPAKLLVTATLRRPTITTPSTPTGYNRAQGHGRSAFALLRRVGL